MLQGSAQLLGILHSSTSEFRSTVNTGATTICKSSNYFKVVSASGAIGTPSTTGTTGILIPSATTASYGNLSCLPFLLVGRVQLYFLSHKKVELPQSLHILLKTCLEGHLLQLFNALELILSIVVELLVDLGELHAHLVEVADLEGEQLTVQVHLYCHRLEVALQVISLLRGVADEALVNESDSEEVLVAEDLPLRNFIVDLVHEPR